MDDKTLAELFNRAAPPAQDWHFTLAVMARIERRRFHKSLAVNLGLGLLAALVLAFAAPALNLVWGGLAVPLSNNLLVGMLVLAGSVLAIGWIAQQD